MSNLICSDCDQRLDVKDTRARETSLGAAVLRQRVCRGCGAALFTVELPVEVVESLSKQAL